MVSVQKLIHQKPEMSVDILNAIIIGLQQREEDLDKKASNIWLVVKNLKPEHLEEMKKLIIPEVFESLNLN